MLTVENLREYGADVDTGIQRCVNKESIYLMLVKKVPANDGFAKLKEAIDANDLKAAFEAAHGLKGIASNLSLTPILTPVAEMTEHLRAEEEMDYSSYLNEILKQRDILAGLCNG